MNNEDTELPEAVEFKHLHKNILHPLSELEINFLETSHRKD